MAATLSQRAQIEALIKRFEPQVREAFLAMFYRLRSEIDRDAFIAAFEAGDIERAVRLFRLDDAALFPLEDAIRATFIAGGQSVVAPTGLRGGFGFNGRHLRAEQWTRAIGSDLIQGIRDDTLAMARQVITSGLSEARGARAVALDLTGTLNRLTGQREGGFLGLTSQMTDAIITGRAKLASGDPAMMREYLDLKLRDKRFDPTIRKAIAEGRPIRGAELDRIMTAHKSKALAYRGQIIARNETFTAQAAGRDEAYRQMLEKPGVADVTMRWQHNLSREPRPEHVAMNGTIISLSKGETFSFPDGARMKHPHDPAGGAKHSIGCRCIAVGRVVLERD